MPSCRLVALSLLLVGLLALSACTQVEGAPARPVASPTWGNVFPTVIAFPHPTTTSARMRVPLASCAGSRCNGTDAYATGCAGSTSWWVVDSVPVLWQGVNEGWDQLWYSGLCGTNWARYVCTRRCRSVELTLMVCNANGSQTGVQGPLVLAATGRTRQQDLPRTPAAALLTSQVAASTFVSVETGCY